MQVLDNSTIFQDLHLHVIDPKAKKLWLINPNLILWFWPCSEGRACQRHVHHQTERLQFQDELCFVRLIVKCSQYRKLWLLSQKCSPDRPSPQPPSVTTRGCLLTSPSLGKPPAVPLSSCLPPVHSLLVSLTPSRTPSLDSTQWLSSAFFIRRPAHLFLCSLLITHQDSPPPL